MAKVDSFQEQVGHVSREMETPRSKGEARNKKTLLQK